MARPRKPKAILVLQGTNRPSREAERKDELTIPAGDMGPAPEWLDQHALAEWNRLVSHPVYKTVLSPLHRGALVEYCSLYSRMIRDAKNEAPMNASQRQTLNSLRMQLGLTPASQSKVKTKSAEPAKDPWAERDRRMTHSA